MQTRTLTTLFAGATLAMLVGFIYLWIDPYTRSVLTGQTTAQVLSAAFAINEPDKTALTPLETGIAHAPQPPRLNLQESYCLLPDETLWDVAQRSVTTVEAIEAINPKFTGFAGSALHLPPGSLPPFAWGSDPVPIQNMSELPFGVSGYFIGHDNRRKRVTLTFDIGYVPENTDLMKLLADRGISATFFVIGTAMANRPDVVQDVIRYGHELANHSWMHDYMQNMSEEEIIAELRMTEDAVEAAHPEASTKPFFRAPFGAITPTMVEIARREGYYTIGWTVDSGDWVPGITPDEIVTRVQQSICPGAILVMHDANLPSFGALPQILDYLKEQEYEVVPLSRLLFP